MNTLLERVWDHAHPRQGTHHYEMEPEMFYCYHIAHMAKHMRFGGCGIRSFVDIWIFRSQFPIAEEKKNHLLKAAGMEVFAEQSERLCRVWFEGRMLVLLPVFWIRRWLELLMKNKKIENAVHEIAMNKKLDKQSIAESKWLFRELELF